MSDIYADAGVEKYTWGGHTWLEIQSPTTITQSGRGGVNYYESFFVLPGSFTTAVSCYVSINVYVRVNENLNTQIKIVPTNNAISDGCRGIYFGYVYPGSLTADGQYMAIVVTYGSDFRIRSRSGSSNLNMTDAAGNVIVEDVNWASSDPSRGIAIIKQFDWTGQQTPPRDYGDTTYTSNGRRYHWQIGLGSKAGWADNNDRYNDNWKGSAGWVDVGNLEQNFGWSSDKENYDGYLYLCGCGYYQEGWDTTQNVAAVPTKVTIPGLRRLMDYFPWAISKSGVWKSCDRLGGHVQRMNSGIWIDRKNRLD